MNLPAEKWSRFYVSIFKTKDTNKEGSIKADREIISGLISGDANIQNMDIIRIRKICYRDDKAIEPVIMFDIDSKPLYWLSGTRFVSAKPFWYGIFFCAYYFDFCRGT